MNALLTMDPYRENLLLGVEVVLIGLGTVFAVLLLIWGCLALFKVFFAGAKKETASDKIAAPAPVASAPVVSNNDEIIAVIAAAIAAAEADCPGGKFRVVSFRKR